MSSNFTTAVLENGNALEDRVSSYLNSMFIPFKRSPKGPKAGIDFIIDGKIYMDCVAQSVSGSIGDKLPTKVFKYIRKYSLKQIYILNPYCPITQIVAEHLEHLEKTMDAKIYILDWNDFVYIVNGGEFEKRKAYNFSKDGIANHRTSSNVLTRYFKYPL